MKQIVLVIAVLVMCGLRAEHQPALYPVDKSNQEFNQTSDLKDRISAGQTGEIYGMESAVVKVDLSKTTWTLQKVQLANGTLVHNGFNEYYTFEFNDGRKSMTISEAELEIVNTQNKDSVIEVDAVSRKMPGVQWRKQYYQEDSGLINKKVTIRADKVPVFLLKVHAVAPPAPERQGAYIWNSPFGYYAAEEASLVKGTMPKPQAPYTFPVTVYPDLNITVGIWIDKINGRTIHARETSLWHARGNGFEMMPMVGEFLGQGGKPQLEYEWIIQSAKGDALNFYREYQARAGYKALMGDLPDPEWLDHVRFAMDCGPIDLLGHGWKPGRSLRDLSHFHNWLNDDPLDAIPWTIFSWNPLGGMPSKGEWNVYEPRPAPMNVEAVQHMVKGLSGKDGRIKVALYDWNHSFDPALPPYNDLKNKSWASWNADGSINSSWACTTFSFWPKVDAKPNYLDPGYLAFYMEEMSKLPSVYGTQAVYIDAEVGQCYADWNTKTWFHPYDQYDFKKKYRLASGDNLPLIKNTPNSPYVSGGYWEGRGLNPASVAEKNWRTVGAKILGDKIWQWTYRWTALLYGNDKNKQPNYSYYTIGLGFKPHANPSIREYGLNRAAFDMRHSRLLTNRFSPCYWRNDDTDIEAYLLEVGGYPVMSFINHGSEAREITFEIDGLCRDGNPLYAWQISIDAANLPAGELDKEYNDLKAQGKNPEDVPEMREKWRKLKIYQLKKLEAPVVDGKNIRLKVAAAPGLLNLATVTTLPVMALSHGNDVVQVPLAGVADVTFTAHQVSGNQHSVTVESRLGATLGFLVPCDDITLDGSAAALTAGQLEVPPGKHQLNFRIKE